MTQKERLISLVRQHPGKTASELANLLGRGQKNTARVASALWTLVKKDNILYRVKEPGVVSMRQLNAGPVAFTLYKLTGEGAGHQCWRYYIASAASEVIDPLL